MLREGNRTVGSQIDFNVARWVNAVSRGGRAEEAELVAADVTERMQSKG